MRQQCKICLVGKSLEDMSKSAQSYCNDCWKAYQRWRRWSRRLHGSDVDVSIPVFRIELAKNCYVPPPRGVVED